MEAYVGKCRYCSNRIPYQRDKTMVTCNRCGETLVVAEFLNEQLRIQEELQAGEAARKALKSAETERDQANAQLLRTVRTIESLTAGQQDAQDQLARILANQNASQETRKAATTLLENLRAERREGQDVLTSMLEKAMQGQETADQKLKALQELSEFICQNQGNIAGLIQGTSLYLHTDLEAQNRQIGELVAWTQSSHQADITRLEAISRSAKSLSAGQKEINNRIENLQSAVKQTEAAVRDFERHWKQDQLNKIAALYHQAENAQLDKEFDLAAERYQQVLIMGGRDPEVYWRLILCHYCVVYQQDEEGKQVLTILYPDLTDPEDMSVRKELKNCEQSAEQRSYYEKELAKLDRVLDKYRIVRLRQKYDVFISVKQTAWQNGQKYYTADRELARKLYQHLRQRGLSVFNSEEDECQCPPGDEWEPYILSALLSSKAMIVVGTRPDHMESQWVKNEWQRFQWLRKRENRAGHSERKLYCYISDAMNPYSIPRGLNPDIQAIVNGVNAFEKVDQAIKCLFPKDPPPPPPPASLESRHEMTELDVLRGLETLLILGKYEEVIREYDLQVSQAKHLSSCRMHLYALCGKYKVPGIDQLTDSRILKDTYYKLAGINAKTARDANDLFKIRHQIETAAPIPEAPKPNPATATPPKQGADQQINPETPKQDSNPAEDTSALRVIESLLKRGNFRQAETEILRLEKANSGHVDCSLCLYHLCCKYNAVEIRQLAHKVPDLQKESFFILAKNNARTQEEANLIGQLITIQEEKKKKSEKKKQETEHRQEVQNQRPDADQNEQKQSEKREEERTQQAKALYNLGLRFEKGIDGPLNDQEAIKWYTMAAEQGDPDAQNTLGYRYRHGKGVPENINEAVKWFKKAADQGNASAQNNLGLCYQYGTGVPLNYAKAAKLYSLSANQGNMYGQYDLAMCYENGTGISKDLDKAIYWYRQSAENGLADAQNTLGHRYRHGKGVPQDVNEEVKWFRKAADQGNASAQNNLGLCFENGTGVPVNYAEAVKLYSLSASQGNMYGQYDLAVCYEKGRGVTPNLSEAKALYSKAAAQGLAEAKEALKRL